MSILEKEIFFSPLVCQGLPDYTILGIDIITRFPELLNQITSRFHKGTRGVSNMDNKLSDSGTKRMYKVIKSSKNDKKEIAHKDATFLSSKNDNPSQILTSVQTTSPKNRRNSR